MLQAYFDESERPSGMFGVAGIAYRKTQAKICGREWSALFQKYGGCHMTDLALKQGAFEGISAREAERLIKLAVGIISKRAV